MQRAKFSELSFLGQPVYFFIVTSVAFGIINCFLIPPFQTPDEFQHFYRAYSISESNYIADLNNNDVGSNLPSSLNSISAPFKKYHFKPNIKTSPVEIFSIFSIPLDRSSREWTSFPGASIYIPIVYFPQAAALSLHRLDISPAYLFYLGRIFALLFLDHYDSVCHLPHSAFQMDTCHASFVPNVTLPGSIVLCRRNNQFDLFSGNIVFFLPYEPGQTTQHSRHCLYFHDHNFCLSLQNCIRSTCLHFRIPPTICFQEQDFSFAVCVGACDDKHSSPIAMDYDHQPFYPVHTIWS